MIDCDILVLRLMQDCRARCAKLRIPKYQGREIYLSHAPVSVPLVQYRASILPSVTANKIVTSGNPFTIDRR